MSIGPDFMIDAVADALRASSVKSTWFVTHPSAAIERLSRRHDLFELGIHPKGGVGILTGVDVVILEEVEYRANADVLLT